MAVVGISDLRGAAVAVADFGQFTGRGITVGRTDPPRPFSAFHLTRGQIFVLGTGAVGIALGRKPATAGVILPGRGAGADYQPVFPFSRLEPFTTYQYSRPDPFMLQSHVQSLKSVLSLGTSAKTLPRFRSYSAASARGGSVSANACATGEK